MSCPEQKEKLRAQLREAYGRIVYSNTTHLKAVDKLILKNNRMKSCQIALPAAGEAPGSLAGSPRPGPSYLHLFSMKDF